MRSTFYRWLIIAALTIGISIAVVFIANRPLDVLDDGIVKYRANDRTQTQTEALNSGLRLWSDANPDIAFERNDADFEVDIMFVEKIDSTNSFGTPSIGLFRCVGSELHEPHESVCVRRVNPTILISTGTHARDCDGNQWTVNFMANIVGHEIGHLLGLSHHMKEGHLLHGSDFVQVPFDDGGLIIPDELPYSDSCAQ